MANESPRTGGVAVARTGDGTAVCRSATPKAGCATPKATSWWARASPAAYIVPRFVRAPMPRTMEVTCTDDACELDMFENHYTYDVPDEHGVGELVCPYCGGERLEEIEG